MLFCFPVRTKGYNRPFVVTLNQYGGFDKCPRVMSMYNYVSGAPALLVTNTPRPYSKEDDISSCFLLSFDESYAPRSA